VVLLRPVSWLREQQAELGGQVSISVPECGIDGTATVRDIGPCPPIPPGPGRVVTGTFRHASAQVLDLHIAGLAEPIGATANHLFWTEDRQQFLRADELKVGERLRALHGTGYLAAAIPRLGSEPVYNLEVQTEHVYHVGATGVLVHNSGDCSEDGDDDSPETKTLAEWLKDEPDLLNEARQAYEESPQWQGINPDEDPVFYRSQAEVQAIRDKSGESGGHHPHALALGGPEGQQLTQTGDTRSYKNKDHSAVGGLHRRIINKIKPQLGL
jgi:hypothetical protein